MTREIDGAVSSGDIQAVSRVGQILGLFSGENPTTTVAEAAGRLGLNRSTTHRYFTSLVAADLLERDHESSRFGPGGLLLQLGAAALGRRRVLDIAPPFLRRVCQNTHLTTVISLWGSSGPVVSRTEEDPTRSVLVTVRVGTQLGLRSAQAKVFLAFLADQLRVDRLLATLGPEEREELTAELAEVRRTAMSSDHLVDSGITAVATGVFDEYGICATVAIVGTVRTLPVDSGPFRDDLVRAAAEISERMGGARPR
ncbi:IclR family transcriptional regulator [Amycolatopsis endophytica]|uniref:DNA-binding IclR family transcriptional regulator n=1 Tax=Amycolatopsis endophytica TaxID=860233 RepID=A0A853B7R2_9PSEU|nr:helix-turn-helix domain-containing protein [Amycolatopsis endophytica]NYI91348.1 DNA-binding IclR family transcriptional regulator [Amycolatopsis endophytica]